MNEYIIPIAIFLGFGAVAGILLVIASKFLHVEADETASQILDALPGANCGGCGYSGCEGYANAVASGNAPKNLCKPGGADCLKKISEILGEETGDFVREIAYVHCNGNCNATEDKYEYIGTQSCAAVEKFYNGKGKCIYGCAGLGDCVAVCDFGAINIVNGVAKVTPAKCTACGKCIAACPNRMISLRRETEKVLLQCNSKDTGKVTRQACKNGCIGCRICEKKCPEGAITVSENRAVIDYNKCTSCGTCVDACPQKCLKKLPDCNVV